MQVSGAGWSHALGWSLALAWSLCWALLGSAGLAWSVRSHPTPSRPVTVAVEMAKARDERLPKFGLELVEGRAIEQPRKDPTHIHRLLGVGGDEAVDLLGRVQRRERSDACEGRRRRRREVRDNVARDAQGLWLVVGEVVRDA